MASTSTSSIQRSYKYDVFISFRGEDTRKGFVSHLYDALQRQSIITYKDDERITKGNRISDELMGSVKDSRFYIIVFSKDYASSSWCLDELVEIMECQKTSDQRAYPVFYDVEPTEVRNQSGLVGKAFSKHKDDEAAGKWRDALKEAANLAGWELKNTFDGHEAKFIQKTVQEISLELRFIDSSVDKKLIGMEKRVKGVVSTLESGSEDVHMIGIKGMGGGGKTTLARAIFDSISSWFEGKSFVANVREVSKASVSGLKELQEQILSDVLNVSGIKISNVHDGKHMMKKRMRGRKVLVVLDDVDNIEQLESLAGVPDWFGAGSRIIITTRDEQVLVAHRVKLIHNVNLLSDEEAICLFSRYTFGKEIPIKGYEEHSVNVVRYAAGLPLTIKVLGSFLCGKTDPEWIDALERLKTIPLKDTLEKLELSYIGLEADYKEIFLDVACILKGWETEKAVEALESCGFHARNGLRVLEQRSLITTTTNSWGSYLGMHDHIEEMGKYIVRRLHRNEPRMHSRLWIQEEIEDILTNDSGNDAIECECIRWESISNETNMSMRWLGNMNKLDESDMRGLDKMKRLRFLDIDNGGLAIQCFPNALRYLKWREYPSRSLIKAFQADNLVGLSMPFSKIMKFWEPGERKVLHMLKFLDMRGSNLITFDLEMTPNIEKLNLAVCRQLVELKMPLGCSKLKVLYLQGSGLRTLNIAPTPNLETLDLKGGCKDLTELTMPYRCPKLKFLRANSPKLMMTLDLRLVSNLSYCHDLVEFHMPNNCPIFKALFLDSSKLRSLNLVSALNPENLVFYKCHGLVELDMPSRCHNAPPPVKEPNMLSFQCPMLTSTNYAVWSMRMEVILGIHGIWEVVSPGLADAKKNNMVKALLFQSIPEDLILQIGQLKTGKEMWEAVKTRNLGFERVKEARLQTLSTEFEKLKMQDNNTIDDFASKLSGIASKSASLGEVIPEHRLVKKFLTSLPKRFLQIVESLEQVLDLKKIGYEDVVGRLKAYEERIKEDDNENDTQGKLFFSKAQNSNKNRDSNKGKGCGSNTRDHGRVRGQRDLSSIKCYRCDKYGHFVSKCPDRLQNHEANLNVTREGDTDCEEGTLFMMNRVQEKIYLNEDKFIPPKIETMTDDGDIWYFDNGASNHMTGNCYLFYRIE